MRKLNPYSHSDYLTVVRGVLVRREKTSPELAEEIAQRLDGVIRAYPNIGKGHWGLIPYPRQVVKIAGVSSTDYLQLFVSVSPLRYGKGQDYGME